MSENQTQYLSLCDETAPVVKLAGAMSLRQAVNRKSKLNGYKSMYCRHESGLHRF
jgi:hypothetical protein